MVFVHRFWAIKGILTESEDFLRVRPAEKTRGPSTFLDSKPSLADLSLLHTINAHPCCRAMNVGEVYLESLSTGIITQEEIDWITNQQGNFRREEEAMALKIGRLLDEGTLQIGCRLLGHRADPAPAQPASPQS